MKANNPFEIFGTLDREFDGLFSRLVDTAKSASKNAAASAANPGWKPAMSVQESADQFIVWLDAPGLSSDSFDIEFKEGKLKIRGERAQPEAADITWHRAERRFGSFERPVQLPDDVDVERLDAEYQDGVLQVVLPKVAAAQPTRINVR